MLCIDTFSSNIVGILYHLKGSLFKINLKTANDKQNDHEGPLRTTELNIVELDTSGNYRDRTSHNKKSFIWPWFSLCTPFSATNKTDPGTPLKFVESGVKHQTQ
jgi:hypothetical protein